MIINKRKGCPAGHPLETRYGNRALLYLLGENSFTIEEFDGECREHPECSANQK